MLRTIKVRIFSQCKSLTIFLYVYCRQLWQAKNYFVNYTLLFIEINNGKFRHWLVLRKKLFIPTKFKYAYQITSYFFCYLTLLISWYNIHSFDTPSFVFNLFNPFAPSFPIFFLRDDSLNHDCKFCFSPVDR